MEAKKTMIEFDHAKLSVKIQCDLLHINRSTLYYKEIQATLVDQEILDTILAIHKLFPYMGSRRIKDQLSRRNIHIGRKKIVSIMNALKIRAIYPKPNLSLAGKEHKKYPYLLRNLEITRPNQVWSTDITYIPTGKGFMYLTAVIDVYSRYIVAWELSNSLSKDLCINVINKALLKGTPEIVNTDQGSQYTSTDFIDLILNNGIRISMDSKGRALDNIWIERFWRSIKYEEIYLKEYQSTHEIYKGIREYIDFYNTGRGHQSLGYDVPESIYTGKSIGIPFKAA